MTAKKSMTKQPGKASANGDRSNSVRAPRACTCGANEPDERGINPVKPNPDASPEEEAKRLARKKAITLKAFQMAYDNHQRSLKNER